MKVFGRKKGHSIKPLKKKKFEEIFPKLNLNSSKKIRKNVFFNFPANVKDFWLEVGFGSGEHINWQLEKNPNVGFFCSETYLNGTVNLVSSLNIKNYNRVKIIMEDGKLLIEQLPTNSISRVFILFPDPWPKKRHHKRRFINSEIIIKLSRIMKSNAELRIATDSASYTAWILYHFNSSQRFSWKATSKKDFLYKPSDWPQTRYEKKAISAGKTPIYLTFINNKSKHC